MNSDKRRFLSHQNAASHNKSIVLNYIRHNSPVSRTDIWREIGLSRAAVTLIIRQLIEAGLVAEHEAGESSGGRRPLMLGAVMDAFFYITFNWYDRTLSLCDLTPKIIHTLKLDFPGTVSADNFVTVIADGIDKLSLLYYENADSENEILDKILSVGLAMPGIVDVKKNSVVMSLELGWNEVEIGSKLNTQIKLPVYINRYSNMHALGECRYGAGGKTGDFLLYSIYRNGVGAAAIINKRLVYGAGNMSGEIGHTPIFIQNTHKIDADTLLCKCGKKGCLESRIKNAFDCRYDGWLEDIAIYSAAALAPLINTLDPEILSIYIDTGDVEEQRILYDKIKECVENSVMNRHKIEPSLLGVKAIELGLCNYMYNIHFSVY